MQLSLRFWGMMTCDCCRRELLPEMFSCAGWCDDCSWLCSPWRSGPGCPRKVAEREKQQAPIARHAAAAGRVFRRWSVPQIRPTFHVEPSDAK